MSLVNENQTGQKDMHMQNEKDRETKRFSGGSGRFADDAWNVTYDEELFRQLTGEGLESVKCNTGKSDDE